MIRRIIRKISFMQHISQETERNHLQSSIMSNALNMVEGYLPTDPKVMKRYINQKPSIPPKKAIPNRSFQKHQRLVITIDPQDVNPCFPSVLERIFEKPAVPGLTGDYRHFADPKSLFCRFDDLFLGVSESVDIIDLTGYFPRESAESGSGISDPHFGERVSTLRQKPRCPAVSKTAFLLSFP